MVVVPLTVFRRWCCEHSSDVLKLRAIDLLRKYPRRAILVAGSYRQALRCSAPENVADLVAWGVAVGFPVLFCDDEDGVEDVICELFQYWRIHSRMGARHGD